MAKAKKKRTATLGTRKAAPLPFKDVVQRLLDTPPEPKKSAKIRK
jgi:hypothetical protein